MADDDILKRLLDAGVAFTTMTQNRAQELVNDLVRRGEVQAEQAQAAVLDLMERSRRNTEGLLEEVRKEVQDQMRSLGVATQDDVARIEQAVAALATARRAPSRSTAKKSTAKKSTARKATAKKSTLKKSTARQATAKRAAVKKTTARKATTKKATARSAAGRKRA